ncbi:MAG: hypothetical protein V5A84_01955 [Planctomycetota bacterium]
MKKALLAVLVVIPLASSCTTSTRERRPFLIDENLQNAREHVEEGNEEEAAQIYRVVLLAAPGNETARKKLESLGGCQTCIMEPSLLGQNFENYPESDSTTLWLATYPVNRVLDLFDIVTVEVGPQGGAYVDVHATHALRTSAGGGGGVMLGWSQKRELAAGIGHVGGLGLMPFSVEGGGTTRAGTAGARNASFHQVGLNRPSDYIYQHRRDYWAVGARVIAGVAGARAEVHPVEIFDALTGWFFLDPLRDDIGSTKWLDLTAADRAAMRDLMETLSEEELRTRMRGRPIRSPSQGQDGGDT